MRYKGHRIFRSSPTRAGKRRRPCVLSWFDLVSSDEMTSLFYDIVRVFLGRFGVPHSRSGGEEKESKHILQTGGESLQIRFKKDFALSILRGVMAPGNAPDASGSWNRHSPVGSLLRALVVCFVVGPRGSARFSNACVPHLWRCSVTWFFPRSPPPSSYKCPANLYFVQCLLCVLPSMAERRLPIP